MCVAPKKVILKKDARWRPRNGCDGRLIAKNLITTIQVNSVLILSETWRRQHKFTWIVVIKIFAINLPSQPFLGCHLAFHIFFHNGLLGGCTLFLQLGCFWIVVLSTCSRDITILIVLLWFSIVCTTPACFSTFFIDLQLSLLYLVENS